MKMEDYLNLADPEITDFAYNPDLPV